MARALKITAIVLGSLLGLIVLAVGVLLLVIDPNDYKPQLTALVKEKTDMTLAIEDRLEWMLWPSIGVELGRTSLRDAEKKETLVAVEKAGVSVALLPLFRRQINIDAVMLDGAKLRYLLYADGTTSWDRMLARLAGPASPGKEEEQPSQAVAFNVKTLEVKDSSLYMKDEKAGVERALEAVAVQAQDIGMGEPSRSACSSRSVRRMPKAKPCWRRTRSPAPSRSTRTRNSMCWTASTSPARCPARRCRRRPTSASRAR